MWPPDTPPGFPLHVSAKSKGYYGTIGHRWAWVCSRKYTPAEALAIYHRKSAAVAIGVKPLPEAKPASDGDVVTLRYILGAWLKDREGDVRAGTLEAGTYLQYKLSGKRIDRIAGHYPTDQITPDIVRAVFDGIVTNDKIDAARRAISHLRQACRYAADMGWCRPVRLGAHVAKLASNKGSGMMWKLYTPDEIQVISAEIEKKIREADGRSRSSWVQFRAMFLLALNGGYGSKELADLPRSVVDLARERIDHERGKTGATHIVPLWPETVVALREVLGQRPGDELVFRTRQGNSWCIAEMKTTGGRIHKRMTDRVNDRFVDIVTPLGLKIGRQGFYKLKHLHATIADEAGDTHATFALRGHAIPGASGHYVRVSDERVREVVKFIHRHLFNRPEGYSPTP